MVVRRQALEAAGDQFGPRDSGSDCKDEQHEDAGDKFRPLRRGTKGEAERRHHPKDRQRKQPKSKDFAMATVHVRGPRVPPAAGDWRGTCGSGSSIAAFEPVLLAASRPKRLRLS